MKRNNRMRAVRIRKIADFLQCLVGSVCVFIMIGLAGGYEHDLCTDTEYMVRSAIAIVVLLIDVGIFKLRYPDEF